MRPFFRRAAKNIEALKQNQSCILAQNFLSCRKLRLEFFRESLFRTATHLLSSTARVNAAQNVHSQGKLTYTKVNLSRQIVGKEKVFREGRSRQCSERLQAGIKDVGGGTIDLA